MYRKNCQLILLVISFFLGGMLFAQESNGSTRRTADKADLFFSTENYWEALPIYKELADADPSSVKFNNRTGICYFFSAYKTKGIPYFEAAVKSWGKDTIPEVYYYLGTSYQMLNQFDKAIFYFNMLRKSVNPERNGNAALSDVDRAIEQCNNGKKFAENPVSVKIFNLGPTINSKDPDYAPVISADESKIIFTSKRKEGTGNLTTLDGYYYEDIYIADKVSEGWQVQSLDSTEKKVKRSLFYVFFSKSRLIGSSINTKDHDAAISLSPDGKTLFVYRDNFIYESKFDGTKWGTPVKLNDNVNEKRSFQPSCSMTNDGKQLYIVSDRPGGIGGKDIYVSPKEEDGNWGPCVNLGENINTEYDEDSPFIMADGKTLYFSSQGHDGMGGFDIFRSELVDGKWNKPQNVGYPINTGADDIFFVMNANETRAYLSSIKDDTYGNYDIYSISFFPETYLFAAVKEGNNLTPINTVIRTRGHKAPIDTTSYTVCRTPGRHKLTLLAPDDYTLTAEVPGYKSHPFDVKIPSQNSKKPFYNEVNFETFKLPNGDPLRQVTTVYSAFFNVDSVVNADPVLSKMEDRQAAYSAMVKSMDPNKTKLNFNVFTFTDILIDTAAIYASAREMERKKKAEAKMKNTVTASGTTGTSSTNATTGTTGTTTTGTTTTGTTTTGTTTTGTTTTGTTTTGTTTTGTTTTGTTTTTTGATTAGTATSGTTTTGATTTGTTTSGNTTTGTTTIGNTTTTGTITTGTTTTGTTTTGTTTTGAATSTGTTTTGTTTTGTTTGTTTTGANTTTDAGTQTADIKTFEPVMFDFAKSLLRDEIKPELEDIYKYLKENKNLKMEVYGHTDSKGSDQFNLNLSVKRAKATIDYFASKGIDPKRLKAVGKGEHQPVAPDENPDKTDNPLGRQKNRRVEFKVFAPKTQLKNNSK